VKILYICHRFPFPPNRGGKIRPFNVIKHLHQNHEVTVASVTQTAREEREAQGLAPYCSRYLSARVDAFQQVPRILTHIPTQEPASMGYFYSRALERQIAAFLRQTPVDLIMVHCSSVAPYVASVTGIPKILDFGDMDSQKWFDYSRRRAFPLNVGYWIEGRKLMRSEVRLSQQFDVCTTTTKAELEILRSYGACAETDWYPNGIDGEYFKPGGELHDPNLITFLGRMDYYPNRECMLDFCRNTLPLIRMCNPKARLQIVGADPSFEIKRLGELPGVTVTGSVSDVRPYLHRSAVMVAPLNIAHGTQNKVLEAMAAGVPVVCSELCAHGVDATPGKHLITARNPHEYNEAINYLMTDPDARRRLSQAAREHVLQAHPWGASMRRLDGIVDRCLTRYWQEKKVS
jgi:hypothetical protein